MARATPAEAEADAEAGATEDAVARELKGPRKNRASGPVMNARRKEEKGRTHALPRAAMVALEERA